MIHVFYNPFWPWDCSHKNPLHSLNVLGPVFLKPSQALPFFTTIKSNTTFPSLTCVCVTIAEPEHGGSPHHVPWPRGDEAQRGAGQELMIPSGSNSRAEASITGSLTCVQPAAFSPTWLKGQQHDPETRWAWCSVLYSHTKPSSRSPRPAAKNSLILKKVMIGFPSRRVHPPSEPHLLLKVLTSTSDVVEIPLTSQTEVGEHEAGRDPNVCF